MILLSNKPLKHSDAKKLQKLMSRPPRSVGNRFIPPYTLIVSEGVKTEPNYIKSVADIINEKCGDISRHDRIKVYGTGMNTRSLLKFVYNMVESENYQHFTEIWLMYDKDDFPYDDFDNTQFSIDGQSNPKHSYHAAWSNNCLELWFVLHFQELKSNIPREQYIEILKRYFPYDKTSPDIYNQIISHNGSEEKAIQRAKELYCGYENTPPARMNPATRVFELIELLRNYEEKLSQNI